MRMTNSSNIDWNRFIFNACSDDDTIWSDVRLITTYNKMGHHIEDQASNMVSQKFPKWGYRENAKADSYYKQCISKILSTELNPIRESIELRLDGTLEVVVHTKDADDVISHALELIGEYDFNSGTQYFGDQIQIDPSDVVIVECS